MAGIPIKPELLKWAIEQAGSSTEDLARATKRDPNTVTAWLDGTKRPGKGDATAISKRLGRPIYFFMLPEAPQAQPINAWYRNALEGEPGDPTAELTEVRAARNRQKVARWALEKTSEEANPSLPILPDDPVKAANVLRDHLQWDTKRDQTGAASKSDTFKRLRSRIERLGILVQLRQIGESNSRGFSLADELAPLIVVNSSQTLPTVRTFTLLHELAHLCRDEEKVCYERDSGVEAWCNKLAANFLMPEPHILAYIATKNWDYIADNDTEPVRLISNRYKTSWLGASIRLVELGLSGQGLVDTVRAGRRIELADGRKGGGGGGTPYTTPLRRIDEFGVNFANTLAAARGSGLISELELRKQLRADGRQLSQILFLAETHAS